MRRLASVIVLGPLLLFTPAACKSDPVDDGEHCAEASDCVSGLCVVTFPGEGYCAGRKCTTDGSAAECSAGYRCRGGSGNGVFSGSLESRCVPTCARCPPGQSCPSGALPSEQRCEGRR